MKPDLFEMARDAGLPVSWWQKAIDEGETPEWRELEKFAELIVQKCADVIQQEVSMKYKDGGETEEFMSGHYVGSLRSCTKIKQHFGVSV